MSYSNVGNSQREKCNNLIMKVQTEVAELRENFPAESSDNNHEACCRRIATINIDLEEIRDIMARINILKKIQEQRLQSPIRDNLERNRPTFQDITDSLAILRLVSRDDNLEINRHVS